MSTELIITVAVALVIITGTYKFIPFRELRRKRPRFALFPKYRTHVARSDELKGPGKVEKELSEFGFAKVKVFGRASFFTRGHLLGDFSVKVIKVRLGVYQEPGGVGLTLEAAWVAAFDTGDFWVFLTELKQKLEKP